MHFLKRFGLKKRSKGEAPEAKKTAERASKSEAFVVAKKGENGRERRAAPYILVRPLDTEKASNLSSLGKYIFEVHPKANKVEIKKEISRMYNVRPRKVTIVQQPSTLVRYGKVSGYTKHWKKAIVSLPAGERIEVKRGA
jgi:large subunit ribosomal protein L23